MDTQNPIKGSPRTLRLRTLWHRTKGERFLFQLHVIWKWFEFTCGSAFQRVSLRCWWHAKVWELLVCELWGKFLHIHFWPCNSFYFPLSYLGHQSFQLWTIRNILVLEDAIDGQGINSWRKMQTKSQCLIMCVAISNLLIRKKQVGQCLEIVWRCINTDWQKRVVINLSYDNQKGILQILLRT